MTTAVTARGLYRSILRAHARHLPNEMRTLGDAYVRSEWMLHRDVKDETTLNNFFKEWNNYLSHILQTARARESRAVVGGSMDAVVENTSNNKDTMHSVRDSRDVDIQMNSSSGSESKLYSFGSDLEKDIEMNLSEEQLTQLNKLREEAYKTEE